MTTVSKGEQQLQQLVDPTRIDQSLLLTCDGMHVKGFNRGEETVHSNMIDVRCYTHYTYTHTHALTVLCCTLLLSFFGLEHVILTMWELGPFRETCTGMHAVTRFILWESYT